MVGWGAETGAAGVGKEPSAVTGVKDKPGHCTKQMLVNDIKRKGGKDYVKCKYDFCKSKK